MKLSLTQFITFKAKVSTSAKMHYVHKVKNDNYSIGADYWRNLRIAINKVASGEKPLEYLNDIVNLQKAGNQSNYKKDIKSFVNFVNTKKVKFFPVGKATWNYKESLSISASPEIGMLIDGKKYYVKLYYKVRKESEKVTKLNINSTLSLMSLAEKDFDDTGRQPAVLNLQNGKLISGTFSPTPSEKAELNVDAANFLTIWQVV